MIARRTAALALACAASGALASDRDELAKALDGRVAAETRECVDLSRLDGPQIVDSQTILYRQSGKRIWRTGPVGNCPSLRPLDTLIVDVYSGQICHNDRFRTISNGQTIPSGYCRFTPFTAYDKR